MNLSEFVLLWVTGVHYGRCVVAQRNNGAVFQLADCRWLHIFLEYTSQSLLRTGMRLLFVSLQVGQYTRLANRHGLL